VRVVLESWVAAVEGAAGEYDGMVGWRVDSRDRQSDPTLLV